MRNLILTLLALLALNVVAQEAEPTEEPAAEATAPALRFGYLSYEAAFTSMPQYAAVELYMDSLKAAYDQEMQRVEQEFNQKYEAFLEGQKDFPRTILLKRQTELEQLMKQNVEFRSESRRALAKAREEALVPVREQLAQMLATVAAEKKLALIINTDANACPFIDPQMGVDVQDDVRQLIEQ